MSLDFFFFASLDLFFFFLGSLFFLGSESSDELLSGGSLGGSFAANRVRGTIGVDSLNGDF
jgi:hypothetical protein